MTPHETAGKTTTRADRAARTRQKILDTSVEMFSRRPYDDVSVSDVAAAADVAHGLVFHHFLSKRNLYVEAMREIARQLHNRHLTATDVDSTPGERVLSMFVGHLTYMAEHPDLATSIIAGGIGSDPETWAIFEEDRWQTTFWWLDLVGLQSDVPALRLMLQATAAATDAATLHWINTGCEIDVKPLAQALLDTVIAALWTARNLDPSLNVEAAVTSLNSRRKARAS